MPKIDDLIPSAKEIQKQAALKEAQKADEIAKRLVAAEAYFLAERRGFAAGNELEDWVTAEAVVDSRLQQTQVA